MNDVLANLGSHLTQILGSAPTGHLAALEQLRAVAYREASTMAYADAFRRIMLAFMVTTPLALPLCKVATPKSPPADAH
jgi:DHA2 family multidrug resistance protein